MTQPWSPEQVVSDSLANHLIAEQFPQLAPVKLVAFGKGFDNTVVLVNDRFVFRFPRRQIAVELLETENCLLPALAPELPLAIPHPVYFGKPNDLYPWPFTGYKLIKGEVPGKLTQEQRLQSAAPLALFLRALHDYPVEKAEQLCVHPDQMQRVSILKRKPLVERNVEKLIAFGLWEEEWRLKEYLDSLQHIEPTGAKVLAHGDIHMSNVVVNEKGILSGVIDWGDAHIGHPAVDLSIIYSFLPPEGRQIFFRIYGEVDEQTKILARFKAIHTILLLALYGHDHGDVTLVSAAKESLSLAMEKDI